MIKIRRHKKRSVPSLNMASMPDLIFTVLFFFMIVTHMRNETVKVKLEVPQGTELTKQSSRPSIINIYIFIHNRNDTFFDRPYPAYNGSRKPSAPDISC